LKVPIPSDEIRAFFRHYEQSSTAGDTEAMVLLYADPFLTADPSGARVVQASELRAALPKRKALFKSIGCKATALMSLDATPLDEHYVMVKTVWRWEFDRPERPELTLPSTFILFRTGGAPKIVFYLTHQDITTTLREHGLLGPPTT
jgi:hypothetical protein